MATQVQFRGGTTSEHSSFNGVAKEVTVDTTKQTLVVQDGSTNGGFPLLRENGTQSLITTGDIKIDSDSTKLYAGADYELQVFHNGTDSIIKDTRNAGSIKVQADNFSVIDKDASQTMLAITETSATFAGSLYVPAGEITGYGTAADPELRIYHSTYSRIKTDNLSIQDKANGHAMITAVKDGAAGLRWDNSEHFATTATGAKITSYGSSHGLEIFKNSNSAAFLGHIGTGDEGVLSLKNGGITTVLLNGELAIATLTAPEGLSASLYLIADEGDDNGDGWRINSNQDMNDLTISNNESGSYVDKITINKGGEVGIGFQPTANGGYCQIQNNKAYTDGADSLATSGSKATFRIKSGNNTSKSLFIGGVDGNAEPYLQVGNLNVNGPDAAYDMHLNKYGGSVKIYSDGATDPKFATTSEGADFNVGSSGNVDIYSTGSGDHGAFRILNSDATANNTVAIQLGPCNNVVGAQIRARATDDFTSTAKRDCGIEILTRLNGNFVEALDFDPTGNAIFAGSLDAKYLNGTQGGNTLNQKLRLSGSGVTTGDDLAINNWGDVEGDYWHLGVNSTQNASGNTAKTNDAKRSCGLTLDGRMGRLMLNTSQTSTSTIDLTHTWDRAGDYTLTGNINVAAGKGINFGANSDGSRAVGSNVLDEYEEGTWTPTLTAGGGGSDTWATKEGTYTRIGNMVTCRFNLRDYAVGSTLSGDITFGGLPFTNLVHHYTGDFGIYNMDLPAGATGGHMIFINTNTGNWYFYWDVDDGNSTLLNSAHLNTGSYIQGNITYRIA